MKKVKRDNKAQPADSEYPLRSQPPDKQLIPEKGEEYLREVANIEDMPNPADDEEAGNALSREAWKRNEEFA